MTDWTLPDVDPIDWEEEIAACKAKCDIFPAHFPYWYSDTAKIILSLDGWTSTYLIPNGTLEGFDRYVHDNGTVALVYYPEGTISTFTPEDYIDADVLAYAG